MELKELTPLILELSAVILIFVFVLILHKHKNDRIGKSGEKEVKMILRNLPSHSYHVLNDIVIPTKYGHTQIDHIVVSRYGIFVIETKNVMGLITGNTADEQWIKGSRKFKFRNPILQNDGHVRALIALLNISSGDFFPIVVFNRRGELQISTSRKVIYNDQLISEILLHKQVILDDKQVKQITADIKRNNVTSREIRRNLRKGRQPK